MPHRDGRARPHLQQGVPLGSDNFVSDFVQRELLPTTVRVTERLIDFEDPQAALYLLRLSYGIVRANHFMRTTPLSVGIMPGIRAGCSPSH